MSRKKNILIIDRAKWRRGAEVLRNYSKEEHDILMDKIGETLMLNNEGKMCCLGFDARACGVPRKKILNLGTPWDVIEDSYSEIHEGRKWALRYQERSKDVQVRELINKAIALNDMLPGQITEREREKQLKPILKEIGNYSSVRFVGKTPKFLLEAMRAAR